MGEGTDRVKEIAQEIDELRDEMTPLVTELDRRRRAALDWKLQAREHAVPVAIAALAIAGLTGYAVWSAVHERREARRPVAKVKNLRLALSRMMDEPELVAQPAEPSAVRTIGVAIARTAATAAAGAAMRVAVQRFAAASRAPEQSVA